MEQKKLRVAVIGAGGWGYQHARAFSGRSDTELVAIAGRTQERTAKRAAEFKVPFYLSVPELMLNEKHDFLTPCGASKQTLE